MIVYRVCREVHARLDGEGARLFGGRWNSPGVAMVYAAEHPALAILEALVHFDLTIGLIRDDYVVLPIEIPESSLEAGPDVVGDDMSAFGDGWIALGDGLGLRVPSVVAPLSNNVLLNPGHPGMSAVRSGPAIPWTPDIRLLRAASSKSLFGKGFGVACCVLRDARKSRAPQHEERSECPNEYIPHAEEPSERTASRSTQQAYACDLQFPNSL